MMEHPLDVTYAGIKGYYLLLVLGGISIAFFAYQVQKATRLVLLGAPDKRFDSWGKRLKETLTVWLGQRKVLEDKVAGTMHVLMFWGFLMLSSDMLDLATANRFSEHILPEALNGIWNGMVELGYTSALIGCFLALNRRVLFTPEKLKGKSQLEGNVILLLIMTICTTSYIVEAGEDPHPTWEMIGAWVADTFAPSQATINAAYWAHMVAICTFLFLIPLFVYHYNFMF